MKITCRNSLLFFFLPILRPIITTKAAMFLFKEQLWWDSLETISETALWFLITKIPFLSSSNKYTYRNALFYRFIFFFFSYKKKCKHQFSKAMTIKCHEPTTNCSNAICHGFDTWRTIHNNPLHVRNSFCSVYEIEE